MTIGEQLGQARRHQGLTQQQVAAALHVTRQTISNWETGRSYPDIASSIACCRLYDLSLDRLLREDGRMVADLKQKEQERQAAKCLYWAAYAVTMLAMVAIILHLYHVPGAAIGIWPLICVSAIAYVNLIVLAAAAKRYRQALALPAVAPRVSRRVLLIVVAVLAAFVAGLAYAFWGWTPAFWALAGVCIVVVGGVYLWLR